MFASGEKMLQCPPRPMAMDTRWKTRVEIAPNCPRCASSNTKFCYYNNYSLSQPRYFCKGCRRYWTKGGSLRNVPVGGGCRKNRRSKSVRLPTTERVTSSYLSRDDPLGNSSSSIGYSTVPVTATDVSNIDLAVVFAKFLNQNSCLDSEPVVPPELASEVNASFNLIPNHESPAVRFPEEQNMIECQRLLELAPDAQLIGGSSHVFPGEFGLMNKQHDQDRVPQFTGSYTNDYGFQPIFSDEIVQAALWSDAPAIPNFAWQASQLHGLESVPSVADDHFTLHSNPLNDNWSSFDLSSYGDLSRS